MTITEVQQETGWGKRGDTWVPPAPVRQHGHAEPDLPGMWEPGDIKATCRSVASPGWLMGDGTLVSRAAYPRLFEAIGFSYSPVPGTDPGGGMFYLPNFNGRSPIGRDPADTDYNALGKRFGSKTITLTGAQMAGHTHGYGHTHGMNTVDTNHAHNVYARDTNHDHAINHWHSAWIGQVKAWSGFSHQHVNAGGYAAEGAEQGSAGAGNIPVNIDGTAQAAPNGNNISSSMRQNWSHDHPSTNYASESPWAGNYAHAHTTNSQSASTTDAGTGTASAVTMVPPSLVVNFMIKT